MVKKAMENQSDLMDHSIKIKVKQNTAISMTIRNF